MRAGGGHRNHIGVAGHGADSEVRALRGPRRLGSATDSRIAGDFKVAVAVLDYKILRIRESRVPRRRNRRGTIGFVAVVSYREVSGLTQEEAQRGLEILDLGELDLAEPGVSVDTDAVAIAMQIAHAPLDRLILSKLNPVDTVSDRDIFDDVAIILSAARIRFDTSSDSRVSPACARHTQFGQVAAVDIGNDVEAVRMTGQIPAAVV